MGNLNHPSAERVLFKANFGDLLITICIFKIINPFTDVEILLLLRSIDFLMK